MQRWVSSQKWVALMRRYYAMDLAERVHDIQTLYEDNDEYWRIVGSQRPEVRELIERFPPWRFYECRGNPLLVRRVLGVLDTGEEGVRPRLKVVTGHVGWNNLVEGGCDPEDLRMLPLDQGWSEEQLMHLRWNPMPSAFLFPLEYHKLMDAT